MFGNLRFHRGRNHAVSASFLSIISRWLILVSHGIRITLSARIHDLEQMPSPLPRCRIPLSQPWTDEPHQPFCKELTGPLRDNNATVST